MRFAFLGKGGSGKTTVTASFIRYLLAEKHDVIAIDADVNVHLLEALNMGLSEEGSFFSDSSDSFREELKGTRSDLNGRPLLGTTPPAKGSRLIRANKHDPIVQKYSVQRDNLSLIRIGNYSQKDVGDSCYHSKLSVLASFLHHLIDLDDEYVVADTTAGTDNVATSLAFAYDINIFVVEPTTKSLSVYEDYMRIAPDTVRQRTYVVGNKIEHEDDEKFILRAAGDAYLGSLPYSRALKQFEQGDASKLVEFQAQLETTLQKVLSVATRHNRDWKTYLQQLRVVHAQVANEWANAMYGCDLVSGLDEEFRYEDALNSSQPDSQPSSQPSSHRTPSLAGAK